MSIRVMSRVWDSSPSKGSELLLLLAIADFANDAGEAWPKTATLAEKVRMSERQVQRMIKALVADGQVRVRPNAGPHGVNVYVISTLRQADTPDKMSPRQDVTPDIAVSPGPRHSHVTPTPDIAVSPEPSGEPSSEPSKSVCTGADAPDSPTPFSSGSERGTTNRPTPVPDAAATAGSFGKETRRERRPVREKRNEPTLTPEQASRFEKLWAVYPRQENRDAAEREWAAIDPDDALVSRMVETVEAFAESSGWQEAGGQFVPHLSTWLHKKRWTDKKPKPADAYSGSIIQPTPEPEGFDDPPVDYFGDYAKNKVVTSRLMPHPALNRQVSSTWDRTEKRWIHDFTEEEQRLVDEWKRKQEA